jgi:hypothetical protein
MDPQAILDTVTRENAASVLASLSESDRSSFEWWFVARYGDRLPRHDELRIELSPWHSGTLPETDERSALSAMHRAILASREPL